MINYLSTTLFLNHFSPSSGNLVAWEMVFPFNVMIRSPMCATLPSNLFQTRKCLHHQTFKILEIKYTIYLPLTSLCMNHTQVIFLFPQWMLVHANNSLVSSWLLKNPYQGLCRGNHNFNTCFTN